MRGHGLSVEQAREAEVEHLDARAIWLALARGHQEQVLGLEVAVDHAARVCRVQHVEHLGCDGEKLGLGERRAALEPVLQRLTVEQLHHDVGGALVGPRADDVVVEHLDGTRVLDLVGRVPLAQEPLAHLAVARQAGVQDLDGRAGAVAVPPLVDRGHAADAEHPLERPLLAEDGAHALERLLVDVVQTDPIVAC